MQNVECRMNTNNTTAREGKEMKRWRTKKWN